MSKVTVKELPGDKVISYYCPGCKHIHSISVNRWKWNEDENNPTVTPSVRHFYEHPQTKSRVTTCHYFIQDGQIRFCKDSQHILKGKHVDLMEIT